MFIGVDVGGTNTDAVLMDGSQLLGAAKAPTTADVTSGIVAAIAELLAQNPRETVILSGAKNPSPRRETLRSARGEGETLRRIDAVMVGTTHFTNALLERRNLSPTAVIRLALPATQLLPPLVDWPGELKDEVDPIGWTGSGQN